MDRNATTISLNHYRHGNPGMARTFLQLVKMFIFVLLALNPVDVCFYVFKQYLQSFYGGAGMACHSQRWTQFEDLTIC